MSPKPYARIAITLPADDLASADRLAAREDRSRSWIIAEAVRQYVASDATRRSGNLDLVSAPPISNTRDHTPGLGESRQAQLIRDLLLTPEERVHAAEETLRLNEHHASARAGPSRARSIVFFDDYGAFLDWKRRQHLL